MGLDRLLETPSSRAIRLLEQPAADQRRAPRARAGSARCGRPLAGGLRERVDAAARRPPGRAAPRPRARRGPRARPRRLGVLEQVAGGAGRIAGSSRSSSAKLVSTITRRSRQPRARSSRIAPTPSSRGITRSISTTSGAGARASRDRLPRRRPPRRRPRCRPAARGTSRSPSRTTAWSSATSTRIARQPRGDLEPDRRARAGRRARSRGAPPSRSRALLHRGQPEAARAQLGVGRGRSRRRRRRPRARAARRGARRRTAMRVAPAWRSALCSASWAIAQHLAVARRSSPRLRRRASTSSSIARRCSARSTSTCLRSAPHRPSRSRSGGRSSRISERSSSSASRASSPQPRDLLARGRRVAVEQRRRPPRRVSTSAEQLLADDVVQLEREPVALGERSTARGCARTAARW